MSDKKEAAPNVVGHAKGQNDFRKHPKTTPPARSRSRKTAPPFGNLGMVAAATSALSAAALRLDHHATLRCLESVPPGAWMCDLFIDQKAKRLIRAMRQGRVHEVRNSIRASFCLPVKSQDVRRSCNELTKRFWESFQ